MAADAETVSPPHPDTLRRRAALFNADRVEQVLALVLAIAVFVFGTQAYMFALASETRADPVVKILYTSAMFVPLGAVVITGLLRRGVKVAGAIFCLIYLIALVLWPLYTRYAFAGQVGEPWVWYLLTVATACAAVAFPTVWAVAYTVGVPIIFGVVRSLSAFGLVEVETGIVDAVYGIIFGLVIVVLCALFRQSARRVDAARDAALAQYDAAVRSHAIEAERVEVDAFVHDSVLAALLAAERAGSDREAAAAATMAERALEELRGVGAEPEAGEAWVSLREMSARLDIAARMLEHPFEVTSPQGAGVKVPQRVANAIGLAAVQAMVNSVQHADGREGPVIAPVETSDVERRVVVSMRDGVVTVEVIDDGIGFDPDQVPPDRLGLRVSIVERMAAAGGVATAYSSPGEGTRVELCWVPDRDDEPSGDRGASEDDVPDDADAADADAARSSDAADVDAADADAAEDAGEDEP